MCEALGSSAAPQKQNNTKKTFVFGNFCIIFVRFILSNYVTAEWLKW
jgi:hypothetical protein